MVEKTMDIHDFLDMPEVRLEIVPFKHDLTDYIRTAQDESGDLWQGSYLVSYDHGLDHDYNNGKIELVKVRAHKVTTVTYVPVD